MNFIHNLSMDIKEEIRVLLLRQGLSMRTLIPLLKEEGLDFHSIQNLSSKFRRKTIRFSEVEAILKFLGFELEIKKIDENK